MLKRDDKVFLRLPKEEIGNKRVLRPGVALALEQDVWTIRLDQPCAGIELSTNVALHFEERQKFLQQAGNVVRQDSEEPLMLGIRLHGTPVSAESRQCFRVSCLGSNIRATIDDEVACEVVDLSATGFGFYGRRDYEVGSRVRVLLTHEGKEYAGHATIQSSRRMTPKITRYGAHCTDTGRDTLARSLLSLNLSVQREQQRRMTAKPSG